MRARGNLPLPDIDRPVERNRMIAYARLGVTELQVIKSMQITPQLRMIEQTIRRAGQPKVTRRIIDDNNNIKGTLVEDTAHRAPYGPGADILRAWPLYLQSSDSPEAFAVLECYHSLPKVFRQTLPIEAFCIAANISPMRILEAITAACVRLGAQASTLIAAVNHPRVVEKTVEMALTDDGIEDRATLHKATGFLPTPKGSHTNITIAANAQANSTAQAASVPAPPPEATIRRMVNRFNDARSQPALPEDTGQRRVPDAIVLEEGELVELESPEEDEEEEAQAPL